MRLAAWLCASAVSALVMSSAWAEQRVGLVIGNANYPDASTPLTTIIADVRSLSQELRRDGFTIDLKENLGRAEMQSAVAALTGKLQSGMTAFLYFSGYGMQVARQTYLIPINAQIWTEADVRRDGISLDEVVAGFHRQGAKVKIVIIDAARRNPYERRFRAAAAGIAPVEAAENTLALFSTAPGKLVPERPSSNNVFVTELIKELRAPKVAAEEAFNHVRLGVSRASNNEQIPWLSSSLVEPFYFGSAPVVVAKPENSASGPDVSPTRPDDTVDRPVAPNPPNPAPSQSAAGKDVKDCRDAILNVDLRITACSRVIDEQRESEANRTNAFNNRATLHAFKRDYDAAIADYTAALRLSPQAVTYYNRGLAHNAKRQYEQAILDFNEATRIDPRHVGSYVARGTAYFNRNDYDRAIADYTQAITLDPKQALALRNRGNTLYEKKEYDQALADYGRAIALDPKDAVAYARRGMTWHGKGNFGAALADLSQAISINPRVAWFWGQRGLVHHRNKLIAKKGNYDLAIADESEAIKLDPKYAWAYSTRGFSYGNKGDHERALADCSEAIRLNAKDSSGYNCRAAAYAGKKDFQRALADYNDALRLDPNNVSAYRNRGNCYRDMGQLDRAIQDYDKAVQLNPKDSLSFNSRGKVYLTKRDYNRATADFTQAIGLAPSYAEAYNNRGLAYKALGQKPAAIADFRKAQSLDPADTVSKEQLRGLGV
ncbi:MAG: tetratricopeptide repeat protein [Xanthobacteraceae bacterium]